jgi:hypothetical protein
MSIVLSPPEARVILHNISWSLYEQLLTAHEDKSSPHFVYDRGELEITVPSYEHEELNRLIDDFLVVITIEWDIEYCNAGSTTFKREDLERGFEPDSCLYVQHAEQIAGKKRLDLLAGDSYVEREQSLAFPALRSAHLGELLTTSQQMPRTAWLRHVRAWAQMQLGANH